MFQGYCDETLIGEGGLGKVYRATRVSTGGVVAIKQLGEVPTASPAWHRAKRELEAMLKLKGHPYVVSVEEIIESDSGPCLVMEYLEGGSLLDRIRTGPLSAQELLVVGLHVTDALEAAHGVGIVHRDVKPHNLLIGTFGQVKVADFGIAALTREGGLMTRTQAFTLAYASPEELDGDSEVGPPADVYSLAATLIHLATGRKPSFRDKDLTTTLPGVLALGAAMSPVVDELRRCLSPEPEARPSMEQLHRVFRAATMVFGSDAITRLPNAASVEHQADVGAREDEFGADDSSLEAETLIRTPEALHRSEHLSSPDPVVLSPVSTDAALPPPDVTLIARPIASSEPELGRPRRSRLKWIVPACLVAISLVVALLIVVLRSDEDGSGPSNRTSAAAAAVAAITQNANLNADGVAYIDCPINLDSVLALAPESAGIAGLSGEAGFAGVVSGDIGRRVECNARGDLTMAGFSLGLPPDTDRSYQGALQDVMSGWRLTFEDTRTSGGGTLFAYCAQPWEAEGYLGFCSVDWVSDDLVIGFYASPNVADRFQVQAWSDAALDAVIDQLVALKSPSTTIQTTTTATLSP